jgi:hypothetical protein
MARINTLTSMAESLQIELISLEEKFLHRAMNLNPHLLMGDGFKNQWIDERQAIHAKRAELDKVIKEIDDLNGNDNYREKYLHF